MAKRLSENEKEEILKAFISGFTVDQLSDKYKFTKLTITRNLKKTLGEERYKKLFNKNKYEAKIINKDEKDLNYSYSEKLTQKTQIKNKNNHEFKEKIDIYADQSIEDEFFEIAPLNFDIDNSKQKDFSSIPIKTAELPEIVFMIVDKNIELETKLLNQYPNWQFLSAEDLNRKTIEIFYDLKAAKRNCNKNQKVIKVPNSKVFEIVSPILISRGITRIISDDILICLGA